MTKANDKNERLKHAYAAYLEEAKRMTPQSAEDALAAIALFEVSTRRKDFAAFHIEQAKRFKRLQLDAVNLRTGKPLSKATIHSRLMAVKAFFVWLAGQPGYKSRISYTDCDYFNPTANDARIAAYRKEPQAPTLAQVRHVLKAMPHAAATERRDRAIIAFIALTGARDAAVASFNLGHIDLTARTVFHDARTVNTKNRKSMMTAFFPVGQDIENIVYDWCRCLREDCLFSDADPLFPATHVSLNEKGEFCPGGLARTHWTSADPIRKLFRRAFEGAGLPYFHPHSFRHMLAQLGQKRCKTPEAWRAWSQCLGHENIMTTWNAYGQLPEHLQNEILQRLADAGEEGDGGEVTDEEVDRVMRHLARRAKRSPGEAA